MTPTGFAESFGVSRETMDRLQAYADLLVHWNARINLVAASSVGDLWQRHIADSAQLATLAPQSAHWLDLGAGAGLPGLIVAALRPQTRVRLIEADQRKCAFLAQATREMGLDVEITPSRIETAEPTPSPVISARALAPLARLLPLAHRFATPDSCFLFPKGARLATERAEVEQDWQMSAELIPSRTDPGGTILRIRELRRR